MNEIIPTDLEKAVKWITSRWPGSKRDWDDWQSFAADYSKYSVGSLKEAVHIWHRRGEARGPNTSQLSKLVAETHAARVARGVEDVDRSCLGSHVWADPLPSDSHIPGGWVQSCVLCDETRPAPSCDHELVYASSRSCAYCLADIPIREGVR